MYKNYFSKNKEIIRQGLLEWKKEKKTVAVWSAGKKGEAFLKLYDPCKEYIAFVFDKDISKIGMTMSMGHIVCDYRCMNVDIIILVDDTYYIDSISLLMIHSIKADICCISDVVFGNFTMEESLHLSKLEPKYRIKKVKIASLTILYNPDCDIVNNIYTYAPFVDAVYIFDNSASPNTEIFASLQEKFPIFYIYGQGINHGIGTPINRIAQKAARNNFDWLITFDQDSKASSDMIRKMRAYVEGDTIEENTGIVGAFINGISEEDYVTKYLRYAPYLTYRRDVIQSGAMHRLDVLDKIGGYDEELFIDQVDLEYCARLRISGYSIIQLNHAVLNHQTGDRGIKLKTIGVSRLPIGKHSPSRYYYQFRNLLYCGEKYREADPIYSEQCYMEYERLKASLQYDIHYEENIRMLQRAQYDAENHILGKI